MGKEKAPLVYRNGKVYMIVHSHEFVEDGNGGYHFENSDKEVDITGREDRDSDFCKLCRFGRYPGCLERCEDYK